MGEKMTRMISHVVGSHEAGSRLDSLLASAGIYPSRNAAAKAIADGFVTISGSAVPKSFEPKAGDCVVCDVPSASPVTLEGEDIPLDIRYEDEHLIVLSKQPYLVCHQSPDHPTGTLANALLHRYGADGLCNVQGMDDRPGIVHRLDGDTSGLMLAARTDEAGRLLMESIAAREVDRRYIALLHGIVAPDTGLVDVPIGRSKADRTLMSAGSSPNSRSAVTELKVLARFRGEGASEGYTLAECKLHTGRTHQIRVHAQYIRHPVVGDRKYNANGPKDGKSQLGLDRQFLHSWSLSFDHPMSGEHLSFIDSLPDDLDDALLELLERECEMTEEGEKIWQRIGR